MLKSSWTSAKTLKAALISILGPLLNSQKYPPHKLDRPKVHSQLQGQRSFCPSRTLSTTNRVRLGSSLLQTSSKRITKGELESNRLGFSVEYGNES